MTTPKRLKGGRKYLLIDGYNVINAWDDLKARASISLEEARALLNERMVEYQVWSGERITVVYDAYLVKKSTSKVEHYKKLTIIFTKERQTADAYIEKKAKELAVNPGNLVKVVTADGAQQQTVMGIGAVRITPRELVLEWERMVRFLRGNKSAEKTTIGDSVKGIMAEKLEALRHKINDS